MQTPNKGEAVLFASPRNAVAFLTPVSVFLKKGISPLASGDKGGAAPLDPLQAFEKA